MKKEEERSILGKFDTPKKKSVTFHISPMKVHFDPKLLPTVKTINSLLSQHTSNYDKDLYYDFVGELQTIQDYINHEQYRLCNIAIFKSDEKMSKREREEEHKEERAKHQNKQTHNTQNTKQRSLPDTLHRTCSCEIDFACTAPPPH